MTLLAKCMTMMGSILLGLGLTLYSHVPHSGIHAPTTRYHGYELNRKAIAQMKQNTVLISAEGFGRISRGTGVLIDNRHVLTCLHVAAADNEFLQVSLYPGHEVVLAHPVYASMRLDLAILELEHPVISSLPFPTFQESHYDGEPITIIGNAMGSQKWFVAYGIISGENLRDLYTDGLVVGGDSGGPWINEQGEILAISDWGLGTHEHQLGISGGVSAREVKKFLKDWAHPTLLSILGG